MKVKKNRIYNVKRGHNYKISINHKKLLFQVRFKVSTILTEKYNNYFKKSDGNSIVRTVSKGNNLISIVLHYLNNVCPP